MCGIAGYVTETISGFEGKAVLASMTDAIIHRGPDDEGVFVGNGIGLAMRRLSIIDIAGGHQPMSSDQARWQLVFNGEIYNYQELRQELAEVGCKFSTASDSEVLLQQLTHKGLDGIHGLNGMFSFALWDESEQRLVLARDRMGVKPLYYYWDGKRLLFASEIKSILATGLVERDINPQAIWDYLTLRYVPTPDTIWKNIYKIPPGHTLTIKRGDAAPTIQRYWDIPYQENVPEIDDVEADAQFTDLFSSAVNLRMRADVPVGIMLSGGLDSSAVAAIASDGAVGGHKLNTFSVGFAGHPEIDELPYAREVASYLGTDHHEIVIGRKEFIDFLPDFVRYTDEPLADLASIPLHYVSQLASKQVKVALSGEGSDEVLGGYDFGLRVAAWERDNSWPQRLKSGLGQLFNKGLGEVIDQRRTSPPPNMTNYMTAREKTTLMGQNLGFKDSQSEIRDSLRRLGKQDPLHQTLYAFCQSWLVEDLLMKADKMSMANSLELRTPFLDYRLVEWAANVPARIKIGPGHDGPYTTKRILRRFSSERVPDEVITRRKQGFPVPVYGWLNNELKEWVKDLLGKGCRLHQHLVPSEVNRLMSLGLSEDAGILDQHRLWNLIILEHWMLEWRV
ncbi:asparagine synthase (glutamine-hydrolyzing) [Kiloniella majae]|uniref:asparagine synthase (glutamine-hydrolyzing) n=1 Tax=Kiloniella majae TaxID=1938558 RepID=UPI000A277207|nr:asparagine synthase (glutamine-hydrolyzing) [Kiloniella majae]